MKLKYLLVIVLSWLSMQVVKAQESIVGTAFMDNASSTDYVVIGDNVSTREDISIGDNVSTLEDVTIGDYTSTTTIGNDAASSTNDVPYGNYFKYSTVQMLYSPTEIGKSGKINSISFKVANASSLATSEVKVYLGHKSGTFSGTSDYVRSSNLTLVYSGSPTLGQSTGWETLSFSQSFDYNGSDNLVVVVTRKSTDFKQALTYNYFTGSGYMLYRHSDNTSSYGDVTNTSNAYSTTTSRPSIRLIISGTSNRVPYYNYDKYSTVQMLYTPTEVGKSGQIKSIAFKVANASSMTTSEVKVYLGHKSSTFSGTSDYVRSSNLTLVYSGSPTLGQSTGWETLTFNQNSFYYNGTDNLVVVVTRKSPNYKTSLRYSNTSTNSGYVLLRGNDDYTSYGDVSNTSYGYSTATIRPAIKMAIDGPGRGRLAPYGNYYKYSTCQMLYTPTEIGKPGKISSIAFEVANATALATSEVKVYLGHKSGTFSSESDYVRSSNLTLVYSGSPTLGQTTGWETLTFNQGSFTYNGTDNLVVVVTRKSSSYTDVLKYYYFTGNGYTLYRENDNTSSYGDVTNTSNAYSRITIRPNIKINIDGPARGRLAPYGNYYKYSTNQMLYTPSEIGKRGKISSLAFKVANASSFATSEVKVYLGHKSSKFSSTSDYVRSSNLTLVYSGSPTLGQTAGWETLTFNRGSFTYNGTDNLVVVITRKSSNYSSTLKYYFFTGDGYALYRWNDDNTSYGDVTNTSNAYSTTTNRPSIRIGMEGSTLPISADTDYTTNGVTYTLHTSGSATVKALTQSWKEVNIASTVSYEGAAFNVTEIGTSAFSAYPSYAVTLPSSITTIHTNAFNNSQALAIIWNSSVYLTTSHINKMKALSPNVLIYVNSTSTLSATGLQDSTNLVVNSTARKVELRDGYDFYCPKQFTANSIRYKRNFTMASAINGGSAGWETIVLPFDVATINHSTKGELTPFYSYSSASSKKPFWLFSWESSGWVKAASIRHNTPYLLCMPNNEHYNADYNLGGEISFSSTNATVYKSATSRSGYSSSTHSNRQFYPSFVTMTKDNYIYNINSGATAAETDNKTPGSVFIKNLRNVKPFEGYIYSATSNALMFAISPFDNDETTGVLEMRNDASREGETVVYDMKGLLIVREQTDNVGQVLSRLPDGIYIVNGKKMIVKKR